MTVAYIIVIRRVDEDPRIGSFKKLQGIVPNSYSTNLELVQSMCDKLNKEEEDRDIKYNVESVNELTPEHEVTTDKESGVTGITADYHKKD